MADDKGKGQSGDQGGQGKDDTANKGGKEEKGEGQGDQKGDEFSPEQQERVNAMVAEERRKEAAKAKKLQKELDDLKNKDLPKDEQTNKRIEQMEQRLAGYEAKELANSICADMKIPKDEREKYIRHVTATDEEGIRGQLKALKKDFGPTKTGTGTNPAKTGKGSPNDSINSYIRQKAHR